MDSRVFLHDDGCTEKPGSHDEGIDADHQYFDDLDRTVAGDLGEVAAYDAERCSCKHDLKSQRLVLSTLCIKLVETGVEETT